MATRTSGGHTTSFIQPEAHMDMVLQDTLETSRSTASQGQMDLVWLFLRADSDWKPWHENPSRAQRSVGEERILLVKHGSLPKRCREKEVEIKAWTLFHDTPESL